MGSNVDEGLRRASTVSPSVSSSDPPNFRLMGVSVPDGDGPIEDIPRGFFSTVAADRRSAYRFLILLAIAQQTYDPQTCVAIKAVKMKTSNTLKAVSVACSGFGAGCACLSLQAGYG